MEENIFDAMQIVFALLAFLVAISTAIFLFSKLKTTAKFVYGNNTQPKYFKRIGFYGADDKTKSILDKGLEDKLEKKVVSKLTLKDMINRYFKENLSITIYDNKGEINQVFDLNLENAVTKIGGIRNEEEIKKYDEVIRSTYADPAKTTYLFTAPWRGAGLKKEKEQATKARVDYYIYGQKGFINGVEVDYSTNGRDWFSKLPDNTLFVETVIRYQIAGDVTSAEELEQYGEDLVNGLSPIEKVEIVYKQLTQSEVDEVSR